MATGERTAAAKAAGSDAADAADAADSATEVPVEPGDSTTTAGHPEATQSGPARSGAAAGSTALARRDDLPVGTVVMPYGRISAAKMLGGGPARGPFNAVQLAQLDEALTLASRTSGLHFSLYLGELGTDSRARAEDLHASTPDPAHAVVIAVSPGERVVEIVTGEESSRRLPNTACRLAVMAMVASFKEGDLGGGLISGLRMLADQAGEVR